VKDTSRVTAELCLLRRADGKTLKPPCAAKADRKIPAPCAPSPVLALFFSFSQILKEKEKGKILKSGIPFF